MLHREAEHRPIHQRSNRLNEIERVGGPSRYSWCMMPMVGSYPSASALIFVCPTATAYA